jgi:hypothetical protein
LGRVVAVALVAAVSPQTGCGMVSSGHSMVTVEQASLTKAESRHQRRRLFCWVEAGFQFGFEWLFQGGCRAGCLTKAESRHQRGAAFLLAWRAGRRYGFEWSFQGGCRAGSLTKAGSRRPTRAAFLLAGGGGHGSFTFTILLQTLHSSKSKFALQK